MLDIIIGGSMGGDGHQGPPPGSIFLSFSCSFQEALDNIRGWHRHLCGWCLSSEKTWTFTELILIIHDQIDVRITIHLNFISISLTLSSEFASISVNVVNTDHTSQVAAYSTSVKSTFCIQESPPA